jgi:DNA-binding NarL/FixJ family response regulator
MTRSPSAPGPAGDTPPAVRARIFLVEDHPIVRDALAQLINEEPDLLVCGVGDDVENSLREIEHCKPDVIVIDLPEGAAFPGELPALPVLLLSDDPAAIDAGTAGLLPRDATARQIVAAVGALAEGLHVRLPPRRPPSPLTPRESEILALIARGLSNKAIARKLNISAHTVKYHLEAVFAKLAVNSRAEALSQGLRRGLVAL